MLALIRTSSDLCGPGELSTTWDNRLVVLSIVFAIAGSYLAMDFGGRMKSTANRQRRRQWFLSGAAMMGLAIWSMHFVGMLALKMPTRVTYDGSFSAMSILAAAIGAGLAFGIMNRQTVGWFHLTVGSTAMGIAIASMHYIGMASMQMPAQIRYEPGLFIASVVVAIIASAGALALAYILKTPKGALFWPKAGSAVIMGLAIAGMHYIGMAAACYLPTAAAGDAQPGEPTVGGLSLRDILIGAGALFGFALLVLNSYTALERQRALDSYTQLNEELERKVRERTAQLEASNRELSAFSYTVSHDLRAPLRAMAGFSQLLLEGQGSRLDQTARDHLERIRNGTTRLGQLIDGLLALSRVTQSALSQQMVDVSALAAQTCTELRAAEPNRDVTATIQLGLKAYVDPRLITSVLQNLLGNAWKFTARQKNPHVEFGGQEKNGFTCFFVRDNGVGFDMAYAHKLFGVFERLHHASDFPGTGIGLATVKRIVERHGGKIWAEAGIGRGATIYFTLPSS